MVLGVRCPGEVKPLEQCNEEHWMGTGGRGFQSQTEVDVTVVPCAYAVCRYMIFRCCRIFLTNNNCVRRTVEIRHASGEYSSQVNGLFDPTEEIINGATVYRKRNDPNVTVGK